MSFSQKYLKTVERESLPIFSYYILIKNESDDEYIENDTCLYLGPLYIVAKKIAVDVVGVLSIYFRGCGRTRKDALKQLSSVETRR